MEQHINLAIVIAEIERDTLIVASQNSTGEPRHTKYYQGQEYGPQISAILEAIEADKKLS